MPLSPYSEELHRSSHRRSSKTKCVLIIFVKFTGKHLSQSLFFNEVASLRPAALLKERLWYRCFSMNFSKFLRTSISKNICEGLLLVAGWWTAEIYYFYLVLFTLTSLWLGFFSFIYDFFIHICFGFETKLANGKLYGELRPILKI